MITPIAQDMKQIIHVYIKEVSMEVTMTVTE